MDQDNITLIILPYIVSIVCALISGITSYYVARRQTKSDMLKLEKQFQLDLEKERKRFEMEKEKMKIEHKYQMEIKQKELDNALSGAMVSSLMTEAMKNPDIQRQIHSGISSGINRKGKRK